MVRLRLQCRRHRRSGFDPWAGKIPWRRKWQPTPVFLPGTSHGQRGLEGYSPWGQRGLDRTKLAHTGPLGPLMRCRSVRLSGAGMDFRSCPGRRGELLEEASCLKKETVQSRDPWREGFRFQESGFAPGLGHRAESTEPAPQAPRALVGGLGWAQVGAAGHRPCGSMERTVLSTHDILTPTTTRWWWRSPLFPSATLGGHLSIAVEV